MMPNYDRLSVVVSVILLCLALSLVIVLPTETLSLVGRGSSLTIRFSQDWLAALLLASMACAGTASIMRLHPMHQEVDLPYAFVLWIIPGLATLLAALLLPRAPDQVYTLGGLAVTGILLLLTITAEYHAVDPGAPGHKAARLGLNFIGYSLALVLFALIHEGQAVGLFMAAATLAGSSLLALDLLHGAHQDLGQTGLYAMIVGLVMAETVWVLSYLKLSSLTAGIFLLLVFYLLTGLARQGLLKLLNRRILVEFAAVALVGLALLLRGG
jgi:hypothetical protein